MRSWHLVWLLLLAGCGTTRLDAPDRATQVSPHALPSDTGHYVGYQVGGGALHRRKADAPTRDEGTWGWDYEGWLLRRRVMLGWWHGRREQGGSGAYRTDGPTLYHEE